jgi:hypothetical protein
MSDITTKEILANLKLKALGGAKIPHGVSNPVLRKIGEKVVIAVFIYTYKKENLDTRMMPRPSYWMIADIESGELIEHFNCSQNDFSSLSFDKLYSSKSSKNKTITNEYFNEAYNLFDNLRIYYKENKTVDVLMYNKYMEMIFSVVPDEYVVFYQELSNI